MSLQKNCADHLRDYYHSQTGGKLRASHAHELVAAFFGYKTAAAMQSEQKYPLDALSDAKFLIPDVRCMTLRVQQIASLPPDLPTTDQLATELCNYLVISGSFNGQVWQDIDLSDHINGYIQDDPLMIEDDLSGEMAETNAYFDELYIDEFNFEHRDDDLIVTLSGSLNGENDEDKVFHGDRIAFRSVMTFKRVSGRVTFDTPEIQTSGEVDMEGYYD